MGASDPGTGWVSCEAAVTDLPALCTGPVQAQPEAGLSQSQAGGQELCDSIVLLLHKLT